MTLFIGLYGKGGIGKSTTSVHLAVLFAERGMRVLQIGCDPKHDSTFPLSHYMIPTVIEVLDKHDFHYENIQIEEIVYTGYRGVRIVEAGGPPAGTGCAGYVIGETIQLLERLDIFKNYDIVIFDVLGDVVCGGFSVPLQYAKKVCIITTNDFDSLFAANRIAKSIAVKAKTYPVRLSGIIGNRCAASSRLHRFAGDLGTNLISVINDSPEIKKARLAGKTLLEAVEQKETIASIIKPYEEIVDYLLQDQSGEQPELRILSDREMFERYME